MPNRVKKSLFKYDNYRHFLRDFFQEEKQNNSVFSHRYFTRKAGFSSSGYCAQVISGKRNLTEKTLAGMITALELKGKAAEFFTVLVKFNQSKTIKDRQQFFNKLESLRHNLPVYKTNQDQYSFYSQWYYPVVREMAVYGKWYGDYSELGKMVRPAIPASRAKEAVERMLRIGLLVKRENGTFAQSNPTLSAEGVPVGIIKQMRKDFMLRAMEAFENLGPEKRHISSLTLAMSREKYQQFCDQLESLRQKWLEEAANDPKVDGVFQINLQMFPLTQLEEKTEKDQN